MQPMYGKDDATESGRQKADGRRQEPEGGKQKAESRRQMSDISSKPKDQSPKTKVLSHHKLFIVIEAFEDVGDVVHRLQAAAEAELHHRIGRVLLGRLLQ